MWSSERGELTTRSWELKELKQLISKKNNHKMLLCMKCTVFLYAEVEIDHFLVTNVIIMNQSFLTVADPRDPASDRLILSKVCLCNCFFFFFFFFFFVGDGCIYLKVQIGQNGTKKVQSVCSKPFPHTLQFGFAWCIINVFFQSCC